MPGQNIEHEEYDPDFDDMTTLEDIQGRDIDVQLPEPEDGIEVVDDTPDRDKKAKPLAQEVDEPSDEELQSYSAKVQKRIKDLTHARHDERRKREALEREHQAAVEYARRVHEDNLRLQKTLEAGTAEYSRMSKAQAEAAVEAARKKLREANEAFDSDAAVAAQEELLEAKLKLRDAENVRVPPVQNQQDAVQTQQQQQPPVVDAKTQQWLTRNTWFRSPDQVAATSYALGLHNELVNQGYQAGSDVYFEQIDARMKQRFPELVGAKEEAPTQSTTRQPGTVVAPAARTKNTSQKVVLTASQVALCRTLGITPQQYAAQLSKGNT
jgi:hypothetical protein